MGPTQAVESATDVLTTEEYALFEQVGRPLLVAPGDTLFRRGDLGTTMYVIVQGGIALDSGDDLAPRQLGRHGFFGELGLLIGDHARSADATAVASTVLLELRQECFEAMVRRSPALLARFLRRAIAGVVVGERDLIARLRHRNIELQSALDALRTTTRRLDQARH